MANSITNYTRNMHYDFKQKLNKVDSNYNKNFQVPEIDWKLNEALMIFIKMNALPKYSQLLGLESSQRSIDNIRPLIVEDQKLELSSLSSTKYLAKLPDDYLIHLSSFGICKKGTCTAKIRTNTIQHDDKETEFHSSSFEWRDLNIMFSGTGFVINTDGTFSVEEVYLSYVKYPKYIHSAIDSSSGNYQLPSGSTLTGYQNCELSADTFSEIVDIAVLITTGDLLSGYQVKQAKTQMTN